MSTVGYGDIYPTNSIEILIAILILLIASILFKFFNNLGVIYAYCINKVGSILQEI